MARRAMVDAFVQRPDVCPCCGSAKKSDHNERRKHRRVTYACGASAWCCEELGHNPCTHEDVLVFGSALEWNRACPYAMGAIEHHNSLSGEKTFDLDAKRRQP